MKRSGTLEQNGTPAAKWRGQKHSEGSRNESARVRKGGAKPSSGRQVRRSDLCYIVGFKSGTRPTTGALYNEQPTKINHWANASVVGCIKYLADLINLEDKKRIFDPLSANPPYLYSPNEVAPRVLREVG
jgi:hypothetical protein